MLAMNSMEILDREETWGKMGELHTQTPRIIGGVCVCVCFFSRKKRENQEERKTSVVRNAFIHQKAHTRTVRLVFISHEYRSLQFFFNVFFIDLVD